MNPHYGCPSIRLSREWRGHDGVHPCGRSRPGCKGVGGEDFSLLIYDMTNMVRRKLYLLQASLLEFIIHALLNEFRACYGPLAAHLWPWFALWPLRSIWSSDSSLPRPSHLSFEASQARDSLGPLRITSRAVQSFYQAQVLLEMGQSNITQIMSWHWP